MEQDGFAALQAIGLAEQVLHRQALEHQRSGFVETDARGHLDDLVGRHVARFGVGTDGALAVGDAVTLLELELAQQVGGELGDQRIGLTIGGDLAAAGVGGTVAEFRDGGVEDRGDRMELVDVDFGGNAFRIALQPGTIQTHIPPPGIVMY
ncbi:hypothetical protein G6F31_014030 [Rhizopus arrhizus]|nr:hypothetical protein G6F31_014030 [Rhizopus arrhizus]